MESAEKEGGNGSNYQLSPDKYNGFSNGDTFTVSVILNNFEEKFI